MLAWDADAEFDVIDDVSVNPVGYLSDHLRSCRFGNVPGRVPSVGGDAAWELPRWLFQVLGGSSDGTGQRMVRR